jgi:hypothetical protein
VNLRPFFAVILIACTSASTLRAQSPSRFEVQAFSSSGITSFTGTALHADLGPAGLPGLITLRMDGPSMGTIQFAMPAPRAGTTTQVAAPDAVARDRAAGTLESPRWGTGYAESGQIIVQRTGADSFAARLDVVFDINGEKVRITGAVDSRRAANGRATRNP